MCSRWFDRIRRWMCKVGEGTGGPVSRPYHDNDSYFWNLKKIYNYDTDSMTVFFPPFSENMYYDKDSFFQNFHKNIYYHDNDRNFHKNIYYHDNDSMKVFFQLFQKISTMTMTVFSKIFIKIYITITMTVWQFFSIFVRKYLPWQWQFFQKLS